MKNMYLTLLLSIPAYTLCMEQENNNKRKIEELEQESDQMSKKLKIQFFLILAICHETCVF